MYLMFMVGIYLGLRISDILNKSAPQSPCFSYGVKERT